MADSNLPLVTVVIPTYNRAHHLPRAIDSVLSQTYSNIEIIVVDDGSTDTTPQLMEAEYGQNPHVRYIRYTPNRGGNSARNVGLDTANGDYISFLDSDDIDLPTKYASLVEAASQLPTTRPHIIQGDTSYFQNGVISKTAATSPKRDGELASDYIFLNGGCSHIFSTMVTTKYAQSIRFDEKLPKLQDYDWFIRLFDHETIYQHVSTPVSAYAYSHGAHQVSKSFPKFDIMQKWANGLGSRLSTRSRAWLNVNRLAIYAAHEGRRSLVIKYLVEGIKHQVVRPHVVRALLARILLPQSVHRAIVPFARRYLKPNR